MYKILERCDHFKDKTNNIFEFVPFILTLFWSISVVLTKTKPVSFKIGLGLASYLHPFFYITLFLVSISFILNYWVYLKRWIFIYLTILLILMLNLTAFLVERNVRGSTVFWYYSGTDYILRTGHLNKYVIQYHAWPGFFIISAILMILTDINPIILIAFYETINRLILSYIIIQFCRLVNIRDKNKYLIAVLYISIQSLDRHYYNAPSFAFLLYVIGLYMFLKGISIFDNKGIIERKLTILFILSFVSLLVSHIALPIIFVINIVSILIYKIFLEYRKRGKSIKKLLIVIILCGIAVLVVGIIAVSSHPNFSYLISTFLEQNNIFKDPLKYISRFLPYVPPYDPYGPIVRYVIFFGIIFATIFINARKIRRNQFSPMDIKMLLLIASTIMIIFVFTYGFSTETYEIRSRIFEILLLPLLIITLNKRHRVYLLILLIISPPANIISKYSIEQYRYIPDEEISGYQYLFEHLEGNKIAIISSILSIYYFYDYGRYLKLIPANYFEEHSYEDFRQSLKNKYDTIYIIINKRTIDWSVDGGFGINYNSAPVIYSIYILIQSTNHWDLIYNNTNVLIFKSNNNF